MTAASVPPAASKFWLALLGLADAAGQSWPGRDAWIAALSPALVADLAPGLALDREAEQQIRLFGRYQQALQTQVLGWIAEAGLACVTMKGFAAAFLYYPTPASRLIGDLDILIRPDEVTPLVALLQQRGFRFGSGIEKAWGFLSDASFMPLHSADRNCNVDIHVKPDSYPLALGLDTDAVFAKARAIMAGQRMALAPSAEHMALILIANLAKDKFAPDGLRKLLDLARLLRHEHAFSWPRVQERAERARLGKALHTTVFLLRSLGTPEEFLPANAGALRSSAARQLLADWCLQREPALLRRLQREWLLAAEPGVALRLLGRRVLGLLRPRPGVPEDIGG